ncbi:MAG TPA: hypothetical protein VE219_02885, partial [Candidatus Sulfotelmatobacter sp.]|nr:hypothetical protein [Candidatus Sulfotelmatobacter sp.]
VADASRLLLLSGDGEIIEPDDDIAAIGSGGPFAHAAARALAQNTELSAAEVARRSLEIAASLCIYTNDHITVETLATTEGEEEFAASADGSPRRGAAMAKVGPRGGARWH